MRDHVEGGVGVSCQCRGVTHSTRVRRDGVLVFQVYAIGFRLRRGVDDLRRTTRKRERMGCEWRGRGGFVASGLELASRVIRGSSSKRLTSTPVKCGVPAICYTNPKGIPTCCADNHRPLCPLRQPQSLVVGICRGKNHQRQDRLPPREQGHRRLFCRQHCSDMGKLIGQISAPNPTSAKLDFVVLKCFKSMSYKSRAEVKIGVRV